MFGLGLQIDVLYQKFLVYIFAMGKYYRLYLQEEI
jgi:hypothetical protein